ncbi:MAG: aminoacyl-tRNA hydrolase [Gammaproteobacteria bacterium]|nr:aminoacyl-tRNA hydrolase [Gammaproteobacteria bacterium]
MSIKLIVGLGNPGADYVKTRHNAGFWFVDALADAHNVTLKPEKRFQGEHVKSIIGMRDVHFLKPMTFMNHSGQSVAACARYYKIEPEEILVAHDELDLDPGTVKLKRGGGHGGHNGLRDMISHLGSKDFYRLRLGIGHPGHRSKVVNYVLHNIAKDQKELLNITIAESIDVIPMLQSGAIDKAMQQLHTKK